MDSHNTPTPNFDNLLLQSLMARLQIRPPSSTSSTTAPYLSQQSLEELLLNNLLSDSDSDSDPEQDSSSSSKSRLAKEEAKLEKDIIRTILSNKTDTLKPNSGQAVTIGEHHICVGFLEDKGSDYRVWEWHGHIMLFDEENGYTPEYIYGNYFERLTRKPGPPKEEEEEEEGEGEGEDEDDDDDDDDDKGDGKVGNLGLKELVESGEPNGGRILHRNIISGSPRF